MTFTVRAARAEDLASIAEWTHETFEWGDYVPDSFLHWIADPDSAVLVCVDADDVPTALVHAGMPSSTEGWLEAARVHPAHKRRGMGTALNHAGVQWARGHGARVVRLVTEAENSAARLQVEKLGYRLESQWVVGLMEPEPDDSSLPSNRLEPSSPMDLDSAWMSWSTGNLEAAGRGLLNIGWQWRKATIGDLENAIANQRLYQSAAGWVMLRPDTPGNVETAWLSTSAEEFPVLLQGLIGHAALARAEHLDVRLPAVDWAAESLRRAGFAVLEIVVYYKAP